MQDPQYASSGRLDSFGRWTRNALAVPVTLLLCAVALPSYRRIRNDVRRMAAARNESTPRFPYWRAQQALARFVIDASWIRMRPKSALKLFSGVREPMIDAAHDGAKIYGLTHYGSFILGAALFRAHNVRALVVMARQPWIAGKWLRSIANIFGQDYIEVDFKPSPGQAVSDDYKKLVGALESGQSIVIAADYYNSRKTRGVVVRMGGRNRRIGTSIARLALDTGAPVIPAGIRQDGGARIPVFASPIDPRPYQHLDKQTAIARLSQQVATGVDEIVTRDGQWFYVGSNVSELGIGWLRWIPGLRSPKEPVLDEPQSTPAPTPMPGPERVEVRTPVVSVGHTQANGGASADQTSLVSGPGPGQSASSEPILGG